MVILWRQQVASVRHLHTVGVKVVTSLGRSLERRSLLHWVEIFQEERARIRSSRKMIYRWKRRGVVAAMGMMRQHAAKASGQTRIVRQALMKMEKLHNLIMKKY